ELGLTGVQKDHHCRGVFVHHGLFFRVVVYLQHSNLVVLEHHLVVLGVYTNGVLCEGHLGRCDKEHKKQNSTHYLSPYLRDFVVDLWAAGEYLKQRRQSTRTRLAVKAL